MLTKYANRGKYFITDPQTGKSISRDKMAERAIKRTYAFKRMEKRLQKKQQRKAENKNTDYLLINGVVGEYAKDNIGREWVYTDKGWETEIQDISGYFVKNFNLPKKPYFNQEVDDGEGVVYTSNGFYWEAKYISPLPKIKIEVVVAKRTQRHTPLMDNPNKTIIDFGDGFKMDEPTLQPTGLNNDFSLFSTEASIAGDFASVGKSYLYNKHYWLGKNRKFYSHGFNGNQYTGGKFKFARTYSKYLKGASYGLGGYSIYATWQDHKDGRIDDDRRNIDQTVNIIGFMGVYGAAFNFGFNLGYLIEDACDCNIQVNFDNLNNYNIRHGRFDRIFEDPDKPFEPYESIFTDDF